MKKLLLILLVLPFVGKAQIDKYGYPLITADTSTFNCAYTFIHSNELNKDSNFYQAKQWIVTSFQSPKNIIQYENKGDGKILLRISYTNQGNTIYFAMEIDVKPNKYRLLFKDFSILSEDKPISITSENANMSAMDIIRFKQGRVMAHLASLITSKSYYDFLSTFKTNNNW